MPLPLSLEPRCQGWRDSLVVCVADGDTFTARCGPPESYQKFCVRLSGIDAPEKRQPFATKARMALGAMVFGRWAQLELPDRSCCQLPMKAERRLGASWNWSIDTPGLPG